LLVDPIPYGHPLTPVAQVWLIALPSMIWGSFEGENLTNDICLSVNVPGGAFSMIVQYLELWSLFHPQWKHILPFLLGAVPLVWGFWESFFSNFW
jgi:hypothetical protein